MTLQNPGHRNEITVVGRLAAVAEPFALPSGDLAVVFRVVVDRPVAARGPGPRGTRVDVIECQALRSRPRTVLQALAVGDLVQVDGALRRRFFRAAGALGSRYEVEAATVRRLARAETARDLPKGPAPGRRARSAATAVGLVSSS